MPSETGVITPEQVEWTFTGKSGSFRGVTRTFYQSELSIDGEVAILSLASRAFVTLAENNVDLSRLGALQKADGSLDIEVAGKFAVDIAPVIPGVAAESAAILFGYYPTDHQGRRAPEYDDAVAFLRDGLTITRWIDVLNTYSDQNDWKRMSAPFAGALRKGVALGLWAQKIEKEAETTASPT